MRWRRTWGAHASQHVVVSDAIDTPRLSKEMTLPIQWSNDSLTSSDCVLSLEYHLLPETGHVGAHRGARLGGVGAARASVEGRRRGKEVEASSALSGLRRYRFVGNDD
ncbi:hypothetical protein TraAM80_02944 [Trypanosoma rangeli]|uniref:Uncharacterized protein n=1 Tax=Trypanosoma rangeli TaxID=5698 RepID=A0A3R7MLH4_TRYRA|nr:uncharacterized protein TraAM80_02944 [Trypanosoma rangeli]RNF08012.1 hypothetical protein TraAM80_02944 [Trypanosoma rangeli]|eukprot:RNF08012.1 hypothetical protein TraAM80_02944 [Trypanosoma rangeli]